MKINKINEKINVENGMELQSCYNDCVEYKLKTKGDYTILTGAGFKCDGTDSVSEIREMLRSYGVYCCRKRTPKTCIYW